MPLFSIYHIFWLALTLFFVVACIQMRLLPLDSKGHRLLRTSLFVLLLSNESGWFYYRYAAAGIPFVENLPLHLCDLAVLILLTALATGRRLFAEMSYYVGFVAATLAIVFPAISETGDIVPIAIVRYFVTHIVLAGGGFYFTFGRGHRPNRSAVFRSYAFILVWAVMVTPINIALGTNYFFTLSAPTQLAWADQFPHWLFVAVVSLIFPVVFSLLHLPFTRTHSASS